MMQIALFLILLNVPLALRAACFHTKAEAALQAGVRDGEGFQLDGIRIDRLAGGRWATVRSCLHPEHPGTAIRIGSGSAQGPGEVVPKASANPAVIRTGDTVEATQADANVRLIMTAIAQTAGAIGDTIRVRLAPMANHNEARFANAVIRSPGSVELEAAQ